MLLESSQITADPNTIDFGIGQPQLELLPRELMRQASLEVLGQDDLRSLNYGHPKGDGRMRLALAEFLQPAYGGVVDPASFLTTGGASQALQLIASVFAAPGDTVLVEEPTYFLAHQIFEDCGLTIVGIPLNEDGVDREALERAVKEHNPSFFYTIPTFQNPTGQTLTNECRNDIVDLAQKYGFLVVADEVYHLLSYTAVPPAPFASKLESGVVLSVGSFSKILAPGLRLGWIQTSKTLQARLLDRGLFKSGGGLNHYVSCLVGAALANGSHALYTEKIRRIYARRVEVMDSCLQRALGEKVEYHKPAGGYFFWLRLPEDCDTTTLRQRASQLQTGFREGERFSSTGGLKNFMRLSFAHYDEEAIETGISRLAELLSF